MPDKEFEGRRKFVEVLENFPQECRFVLETPRDVYRIEAATRGRKMSPEEWKGVALNQFSGTRMTCPWSVPK